MKKIMIAFVVLLTVNATAQEIQPVVSVTGEGIVKIIPDEVTIRVSVENTGKEVKAVKTQNDQSVDAVLRFLKQFGIADKDMQTQHVRLNKSYDYNTKVYQFSASQSITILLRDISKYDAVISGLLENGINRIDGISFGASNIEELKAQARIKAVANAKTKAVEYAGELRQKIGKALIITETSYQNLPPTPIYKMAFADATTESGMETLAVGEMSVTAKINVSFELL